MYLCVWMYFLDIFFFMMRLQKSKKDLIFWSDHGVEVQTCTEVVFLKSDEKIKFLKLLEHITATEQLTSGRVC